jgi:hypothetical protein
MDLHFSRAERSGTLLQRLAQSIFIDFLKKSEELREETGLRGELCL